MVTSLVVEHRLWGTQTSVVAACGLQSMGSVVVVHVLFCPAACGISPGPGIQSVFPALAGRFLTFGPPGKSSNP